MTWHHVLSNFITSLSVRSIRFSCIPYMPFSLLPVAPYFMSSMNFPFCLYAPCSLMIILNMISPGNHPWKSSVSNLTHLFSAEHIAVFHLAKCLYLPPVWHGINALPKFISKAYWCRKLPN